MAESIMNKPTAELKLRLLVLENDFQKKQNTINDLCDEIEGIKKEYDRIISELEKRQA